MKFKLKKYKLVVNIFWTMIFILALALTSITSSYMQKFSSSKEVITPVVKTDKEITRSEHIKKYIDTIAEGSLVDVIDIKKEVTSILTTNTNRYESVLFDYETGKEITIDSLIKSDKKEDFKEKITELLYLKYPKFIADVLSNFDKTNVYFMKDNELIIYYYDYDITPTVKEDLYLTVNYNEIKDYLNITVDLDSEYSNEDGSIINPAKKQIAITFDDGPGAYTERLSGILEDNHAHSTFFMLGKNMNYYQDVIKKLYQDGNEIGYHSYAHKNFLRQNISDIQAEFNESNEILKSIIGEGITLTRPPYGSINSDVKKSLDTVFILWNIDTEDWRHKDALYLTNYVMNNVFEGAIILFHDIHKTSVDTMEKLLPLLYVEGYQLVTVSDLASINGVTLENHQTYRYFK